MHIRGQTVHKPRASNTHLSSVKQHCTSKLSSFEDLERVGTFGFRGEALASLCTIATVTVRPLLLCPLRQP